MFICVSELIEQIENKRNTGNLSIKRNSMSKRVSNNGVEIINLDIIFC